MSQGPNLLIHVSSLATDAEARFEVDRQLALAGELSAGLVWDERYSVYDWDLVKRQITQADVFLLMLNDDYGAITSTGISHQHRELVYAQSLNKPVYHLTHIGMDGHDTSDIRIRELRQLVCNQIPGKVWHLKDELTVHVRTLIQKWDRDAQILRDSDKDRVDPKTETPRLIQTARITPNLLPERKMIELETQANVYRGGNLANQSFKLPMKTDQIWRSVLPLLRVGTSEDRIRTHLEQIVAPEVKTKLLSAHPGSHAVDGVKIERDQFGMLLRDWAIGGFVVNMKQGARLIWSLPT